MSSLQHELDQFIGTEYYYYLPPFPKHLVYTDGVRFLATEANAYWLIQFIFGKQIVPAVRKEEFQVWKLKVEDREGVITCDDGNGNIVFSEKIDYTDFPAPEIKLYFTDNVLLLPSEY